MLKEYQNNLSNSEFLYIVYVKMNKKIEELIMMRDEIKESKNLEKKKEYYQIKSNLIEIIIQLSMNTNNQELKDFYNHLNILITLDELNQLKKEIQLK
jgi:hypothetical protein